MKCIQKVVNYTIVAGHICLVPLAHIRHTTHQTPKHIIGVVYHTLARLRLALFRT